MSLFFEFSSVLFDLVFPFILATLLIQTAFEAVLGRD